MAPRATLTVSWRDGVRDRTGTIQIIADGLPVEEAAQAVRAGLLLSTQPTYTVEACTVTEEVMRDLSTPATTKERSDLAKLADDLLGRRKPGVQLPGLLEEKGGRRSARTGD